MGVTVYGSFRSQTRGSGRVVDELDLEWVREVLQKWVRAATAALNPGQAYGFESKVEPLRQVEHQTRRVIQRVLRLEKLPIIVQPSATGKAWYLREGIGLAQYALGVLATETETRKHLGSDAPSMSADALHPTIWKAAAALWADRHFGQAVQRAATFLNAEVQDRLGRHDVSDAQLMAQAFSSQPPELGKPRLRWPGEADDLTVKAMRAGMLHFGQGCFMAIRNPTTHGTDEIPRQEALEFLATLSTLARWADHCEVERAAA